MREAAGANDVGFAVNLGAGAARDDVVNLLARVVVGLGTRAPFHKTQAKKDALPLDGGPVGGGKRRVVANIGKLIKAVNRHGSSLKRGLEISICLFEDTISREKIFALFCEREDELLI